jgi:hypothetical protein
MKITVLWLFFLSLLGGCENPPCSEPRYLDQTYLYWLLREEASLEGNFELPPFLYVTTTDLDSDSSVRDRALLEEKGDSWGLDDEPSTFVAPPIECDDEPGLTWYSFRIRFELGTANGQSIDEIAFPPIELEFPRDHERHLEFPLWGNYTLVGYLDGTVRNESNVPVDTGTW